jgi:hypothetical protein
MPKQLRRSHRSTWVLVIIFLIVYFVNMIIFCVQSGPFNDWCLSKSRMSTLNTLSNLPSNSTTFVSSNITSFNSSTVSGYQSLVSGSDLYNCSRLREDEIKLSVVVFIILFTLYVSLKPIFDSLFTYISKTSGSFCFLFLVLHSRSFKTSTTILRSNGLTKLW